MLIHASCVAINGKAVLLAGPPGTGKTDVALRLMDGGAALVSDDQTCLEIVNDVLTASPPVSIQGMIEVRHVGLARVPFLSDAPVVLYIALTNLDDSLERLPEPSFLFLLDRPVQRLRLPSFAASTPAKIRAALTFSFTS